MADNFTNQLLQTVRNKVSLDGGLSIKGYPVPGTLSDIQNFKIEDGVLKFRLGTKTVCSDVGNKQFYFLKNFELCGSEVLLGLSKQRCLYAWFSNYEEYMFTVRNASPFYKNSVSDEKYESGELFGNGSKFWAYENRKFIMFFNDMGEIRVIVKDGGFRINKAKQYIECDIKDATNRVFDIAPTLKADTRTVAPRITGEVRFARVNELGVVSELTEPQYLQDWKSVLATRIPIQTFQHQNLATVKESESEAAYKYIYAKSGGELEINGSAWVKPTSADTVSETPAMVVVFCEDTKVRRAVSDIDQDGQPDGDGGTQESTVALYSDFVVIPKGIYLVLMDDYKFSTNNDNDPDWVQTSWDWLADDTPAQIQPWTVADDASTSWKDNTDYFFETELRSVKYPQYNVNQICEKQVRSFILRRDPLKRDIQAYFPQYNAYYYDKKKLSDVLFNNAAGAIYFRNRRKIADGSYYYNGGSLTKKSCIDSAYVFNISCDSMKPIFFYSQTNLYRLADNEDLYREAEQEHFTISCVKGSKTGLKDSQVNSITISAQGKVYAIDKFRKNFASNGDTRVFQPAADTARAYKCSRTHTGYNSVYTISDIDTLQFKEDFDNNVVIGSNYIFNESDGTLDSKYTEADFMANRADVMDINDRFAIWNNNKIIGVSQRFFAQKHNAYRPVYEGNYQNLVVKYSPIISLEFSNQRAFRYELPLISRAIRNPQFLCVSNGTVYSFEDNRLWYGNDYDFMMKGYAYLDGSLLVLIPYNEGALACTTTGLYYVNREVVQPVVNGRMIRARYAGQTQVGGVVVADNKVYIVRTEITDSGARIETANIISVPIDELVFEGRIKVVCDKRQLYLADDYNIYGFDTQYGIWNLRYNYDDRRISDIYVMDGKLGVVFDNQIDEKKANTFDEEDHGGLLL